MKSITVSELSALSQQGTAIELIDVRTPAEYRSVHVPFARNIPLDQLDATQIAETEKPVYFICQSGKRSSHACEKLVAAGRTNAVNVSGGTVAWTQAGFPVDRGQAMMSLERQVRIAAGLLIVVGNLLMFVHPYFLIVSSFVGAGLFVAGITDTCGMGMLLAKMPWNQVSSPSRPTTTPATPQCEVK